jgi:hypothetical protein
MAVCFLIILILLVLDRSYVKIGTILCMFCGGPIIDFFSMLLAPLGISGASVVVRIPILVLGCLGLAGCGIKHEKLDEQMALVVTALNEGDEAAFTALLYPGMEKEHDLHELFAQLEEYWVEVSPEELSLVSFDIYAGTGGKSSQGMYAVPGNEKINTLILAYAETDDGAGVSTIYLQQRDGQESAAGKRNVLSLILSVLCAAVQILTIVDILVKKPRKYGWYILLALIFFSFTLHLNGSALSLTVPLGAILYWCLRKKLLWEKARQTKTPVSSVPLSPDLPEVRREETREG